MPKPTASLSIISLFTSPDRAAEIEGDLIEQAHAHGRIWYLYQVGRTSLALCRAAIARDPVLFGLLSFACYELGAKLYFWGIRPLRWYVEFEWSLSGPVMLAAVYALVGLVAVSMGSGLVRLVPRLGAPVALGTISLFFLRLVVLNEGFSVAELALWVAAPMLAGCALANWMHLWNLQTDAEID